MPRAIRLIKSRFPDAVVCTDVALDPYSSQVILDTNCNIEQLLSKYTCQGHDGVVLDGRISNDITIHQLQKQAVMQARAGADVVAPSGERHQHIVFYPSHVFN